MRNPSRKILRCVLFECTRGIAGAVLLCAAATLTAQQPQTTAPSQVLLQTMEGELHRAMGLLGKQPASSSPGEEQKPPYFLSYSVADASSVSMTAQYGGLLAEKEEHQRIADVQVRIGSPALDNTHGTHRASGLYTIALPTDEDRVALARSLWSATNAGYGRALESYLRVKTDAQVRAKEEDSSPDFSQEKSDIFQGKAAAEPKVNKEEWAKRIRGISGIFRRYPDVYLNLAGLTVQNETDYLVSSEGSKVVTPHFRSRVVVLATTRAEDGMDLFRYDTYEAQTPEQLPSQAELEAGAAKLGESLEKLRTAPLTEPFNGPAILSGRAAGVFFHEVLGHRLEGQRQRGDEEGQTFTKNLNKPILPSFLSVADDPTMESYEKTHLSGYYEYDDEGQKARRVDLIQDGVLKTFLMSRLPIASFSASNGHGRSQTGLMPTGRQGNLIVTSTKTVPDADLRKLLIEEAKKQGKAYGLYFEDISSGFAVTQRSMPQAFQVMPLVVYRVYVDGRPDELVRGVNIVGTPQAALNRILVTGTTREVFNGECGAESGSVPVSAIAPAMLVSEIETQRQQQGTARPPILPIPTASEATTKGAR